MSPCVSRLSSSFMFVFLHIWKTDLIKFSLILKQRTWGMDPVPLSHTSPSTSPMSLFFRHEERLVFLPNWRKKLGAWISCISLVRLSLPPSLALFLPKWKKDQYHVSLFHSQVWSSPHENHICIYRKLEQRTSGMEPVCQRAKKLGMNPTHSLDLKKLFLTKIRFLFDTADMLCISSFSRFTYKSTVSLRFCSLYTWFIDVFI